MMNEASLKAKMREIALDKQTTPDKIWKQLQLQRFLARLSESNYRQQFILKGAVLLAQYVAINRETVDVDFSLQRLAQQRIEEAIKKIISINLQAVFILNGSQWNLWTNRTWNMTAVALP